MLGSNSKSLGNYVVSSEEENESEMKMKMKGCSGKDLQ